MPAATFNGPAFLASALVNGDYSSLDDFTQGYIEAAFFTDTGPDHAEEGLDDASSVAEIAPVSLAKITADCAAFQQANAALLAEAYERDGYDPASAGRDYWFTRNGHGVGFWDRTTLDAEGLGDRLTEACGRSEMYLYRGDDGLIYFE